MADGKVRISLEVARELCTCPLGRKLSVRPTYADFRQYGLFILNDHRKPVTGWRCPACGATSTLMPTLGPVPPHHGRYGVHPADLCGLPGPYEWCGAIRWRRPWRWTRDPRSDG